MKTPLDFAAIAERADLSGLIHAELGQPNRSRKWLCPFHDDHNPSLSLSRDGRRFKCWSCGTAGTALDWVMKRERVDVVEAARMLGGLDDRQDRRAKPKPPSAPSAPPSPPAKSGPWQDPAWQVAVDELVARAEAHLWSRAGRPALDWLRGRALADHTIRRFRLGFNPAGFETDPLACLPARDDGRLRGITCVRGIVIPWGRPGSWYGATPDPSGADPRPRWVGANVRKLKPDVFEPWSDANKCQCLNGSERGFPYPFGDVIPGIPALVMEGEFDALIGWQQAGWVVNPISVGGATQKTFTVAATEALDACPSWLLAFDHDRAGNEAARSWWLRSPDKANRVFLPTGKDLTEFVCQGGNVLEWLRDEFTRFGWRWPLRMTGEMEARS